MPIPLLCCCRMWEFSFGKSKAEARITGEFYVNAIHVVEAPGIWMKPRVLTYCHSRTRRCIQVHFGFIQLCCVCWRASQGSGSPACTSLAGSRNTFLNRLTAEATGLDVQCGAVERSTIGNFAVQLAALDGLRREGGADVAHWAWQLAPAAF
jgi:hypothetical protein